MRFLWVTAEGRSPPEADRRGLEKAGAFSADVVSGPALALEDLRDSTYDAVLAEFPIPGWTAEEWLEEVQRLNSFLPVLIRPRRCLLRRRRSPDQTRSLLLLRSQRDR